MTRPFTMLMTGLSGAGKTTNAQLLAEELTKRGVPFQILDGDIIREEIGNLFGYSREERNKVSKIHRFLSKMLNKNGISVVVAAISPYEEMRTAYRDEIADYVEVYVHCPIEVCIERDVKGLYQKALRGDVKHVIGVDEQFEIPTSPDITLNTSASSKEQNVAQIMNWLASRDYV
jgi:adenylylsulfate kinase